MDCSYFVKLDGKIAGEARTKGGLAALGGSCLSCRGPQSIWHLTGGGPSGNAANMGWDRFAADGVRAGALSQQA